MASVTAPQGDALLHDATLNDDFCTSLWQAIELGRELPTQSGHVKAVPTAGYADVRGPTDEALPIVRNDTNQANVGIRVGGRMMLKLFRRIEDGVNPDLEIGRFLSERGEFQHTPQMAGAIEYTRPGSEPMTLVLLQSLVRHQRNGWDYTIEELQRYFERASTVVQDIDPSTLSGRSWLERSEAVPPVPLQELINSYLQSAATLGLRTGELHRALAADTESPAFAPEPLTT